MTIKVLNCYALNSDDLSWAGLEKRDNLTVYDRPPTNKIVEQAANTVFFTERFVTSRNSLTFELSNEESNKIF